MKNPVEEEIWALENAYFKNLYKADYEAVLAIVHSQFLGGRALCRDRLIRKEVPAS